MKYQQINVDLTFDDIERIVQALAVHSRIKKERMGKVSTSKKQLQLEHQTRRLEEIAHKLNTASDAAVQS